MITPFSWPVNTLPWVLDSRSKARPYCGSVNRSTMGSFNSASSTINRRLAASAAANDFNAGSPSLGRVRVNRQDAHSSPCSGSPGVSFTSQLHSARCILAHSRYSLESTAPSCSLSGPEVMTSSTESCSENPTALPQARHSEFSKARC